MVKADSDLQSYDWKSLHTSGVNPYLHWNEAWFESRGKGVTIGVLDTAYDSDAPDLSGANIQTKDFVDDQDAPHPKEHGTFSVSLLVGQGNTLMRGLVPSASVLFANVVGSEGIAKPESVSHGIRWMATAGASVVAIPLGDHLESNCITTAVDLCNELDCLVLAAAGNQHPDKVLFPARSTNTVAVAGADAAGTLLPTSCRNPGIDLISPGWHLPGIVDRHVARRSGSSIATIVAAGIAGLLISTAGPLKRERFLNILLGLESV